jgi:hypothetical protein
VLNRASSPITKRVYISRARQILRVVWPGALRRLHQRRRSARGAARSSRTLSGKASLRATSAEELLEASIKTKNSQGLNGSVVDGWFLPQDAVYPVEAGRVERLLMTPR